MTAKLPIWILETILLVTLLVSCSQVKPQVVDDPRLYLSDCNYIWVVWTKPVTDNYTRLEAHIQLEHSIGTNWVKMEPYLFATGTHVWNYNWWRYKRLTVLAGYILDKNTDIRYPIQGLPHLTRDCNFSYLPMVLKGKK